MTISDFEALTGTTVTNEALVTAQIARTQRMLEDMLGYTLDPEMSEDNHYTEIGKTSLTCPCPDVDMESLQDPDEVVGAYRIFNYNRKEKIISIDPCTEVHAVKLVKDGLTFKTFEADEYRKHIKHGFIKYIEECENCCWCTCVGECYCVQLAVDADWLWTSDLPSDLLDVWASFITYYSDSKKDIQQERLGSHSYAKFYDQSKNQPMALGKPEIDQYNLSVLTKYAGANSSIRRILTV